jgi:HEAT repeats
MRKRLILWGGVVVGVAILVVFLDPTYVLLGLLRGENFYRSRPESYWRVYVQRWLRKDPGVYPHSPPFERPSSPTDQPIIIRFSEGFPPEGWPEPEPEAVPVLTDLLQDKDDQVCFLVCNTLARIGPRAKAAAPVLGKMLKAEGIYCRRNAANTLANIGPEAGAALPDLIDALKDEDPWVNYYSATTLGEIGADAKAAVPALLELLTSDRAKQEGVFPQVLRMGTVGDAVAWALWQIDPEVAAKAAPRKALPPGDSL